MSHDQHTVPSRQVMSNILCGTVLTFALLLGFVSPSWALQVSPSALTFSATSGGTDPSPQTVVLSSSRTRVRTWTATEHAFIGYDCHRNRYRVCKSLRRRPRRWIVFSKHHNHRDQSGWVYQKDHPPGDAVGHRSPCDTGNST